MTLRDLRGINSQTLGAALGSTAINARKQDSDANLLANPRIRVKNREKAKILIGDKVPNITTTTTATGFVAENVQYIDVGLKLDVEPTIYLDNEVGIRISLEVSNIVSQTQTKNGAFVYQIGTRTAATVLRLKDGENQVLAGLINDEDRTSANKVPGLGEIPIIGRLFGSQLDNNQKTEIVLSITPRLIRNIQRPGFADGEFESGTEASLRLRTIETAGPAADGARPTLSSGDTGPAAALQAPAGNATAGPAPAAAAPAAGAQLSWQGATQAKVGSTFVAQLMLQSGEPVSSVPMAIGFDPKVLEVVTIAEGDFLKQGGSATNFSHRVDAGAGQIFATANRAAPGGASGSGTLLNITFKALAAAAATGPQVLSLVAIGLNGRPVAIAMPAMRPVSLAP